MMTKKAKALQRGGVVITSIERRWKAEGAGRAEIAAGLVDVIDDVRKALRKDYGVRVTRDEVVEAWKQERDRS